MKATAKHIATLKALAQDNYDNGMDTMVECWGDAEYTSLLNDSETIKEAMASMEELAEVYRERQDDADKYREEDGPAPVAPVEPDHTASNTIIAAGLSTKMYTITAKAKIVAPHLTLQRGCTTAVGAHWRSHGHKAPNTRHEALSALAGLGGTFTLEAAALALKPLKDAAILGSGTPASYLKAFLKAGYIAEVA